MRLASEKRLESLLIGGNALILLGHVRATVDLDLLVSEGQRSQWLDFLRELGYRLLHGVAGFAQFEPVERDGTPVDLMFVDEETWRKLRTDSREMTLAGQLIHLPRPEYLVALKLHAASSKTRTNPELDWADIRQIVTICQLNPNDPTFRELILRYGGENGLAKIKGFKQD